MSLDEIVGRTPASSSPVRLRHPKLKEFYEQVDALSLENQSTLSIFLDSLLERSEIGRVVDQVFAVSDHRLWPVDRLVVAGLERWGCDIRGVRNSGMTTAVPGPMSAHIGSCIPG